MDATPTGPLPRGPIRALRNQPARQPAPQRQPVAFFFPCTKRRRQNTLPPPLGEKSGLTPLFRDFHGALAPTARAGSHAGKPLLRKAFCGFAVHPQGAFSCPFGTIHLAPPKPTKASGGQSRAPPVAGGARWKPSEQGSARKAPRADAARPLRTALRPRTPKGFSAA